MKRLHVILAASLLTLSATSYASHNDISPNVGISDHDDGRGNNWAAAADLAYRLADLGESYSRSYDYRLSNAASSMHYLASDLYRVLRNMANGGFGRYDHSGGNNYYVSQMMQQLGYRVDAFTRVAPYYAGSQARSLYYSMNNYVR